MKSWSFSVSVVRNEVYVYDRDVNQIFSIHGHELNLDFTSMIDSDIERFILSNYGDVLADLT